MVFVVSLRLFKYSLKKIYLSIDKHSYLMFEWHIQFLKLENFCKKVFFLTFFIIISFWKKKNYIFLNLFYTISFWKKKNNLFEILSQCTIPNTISSYSKFFLTHPNIILFSKEKIYLFITKKSLLFKNGYTMQTKP